MQRSFYVGTAPPRDPSIALVSDSGQGGGNKASITLLADQLYSVWETDPVSGAVRGTSGFPAVSFPVSDDGAVAKNPASASDPNGLATVVVWEQAAASQQIFGRRLPKSATPAPAVQISKAMLEASSPAIALDASGRAIAVWQEKLSNGFQVVAARFEISTGWSPPVAISDPAAGIATNPTVAMEPGGNAVLLFQQSVDAGTAAQVLAARFTVVRGFEPNPQVLWKGGPGVSPVSVAIDAEGRALAVWTGDDFVEWSRFE